MGKIKDGNASQGHKVTVYLLGLTGQLPTPSQFVNETPTPHGVFRVLE